VTSGPPPLPEFRAVDGVVVPDLHLLSEGFQVRKRHDGVWEIRVTVSAERIPDVFRRLVARIQGLGYFVLETGTHRDEEEKLRKESTDDFHCDVWYLDGIQPADAIAIFDAHERLLVHDAMIRFGFGSHAHMNEVFIGAYKLFYLFVLNPAPATEFLRDLGFPEVAELRTAWSNFTDQRPGSRLALVDEHPSQDDLLSALRARGLRLAERRPDQ
jgi:hypothetical protein